MKRKFCCDASQAMYEDYYMNQQGQGPVFYGSRNQRGHGLDNILSGMFRSALPMVKKGLAYLGTEALKTGAQIANDVADGGNFFESAKKRAGEGIKRLINPDNISSQSGSGRRRTYKRKRAIKKKPTKKRKTKHSDIFS